MAAEAAAAQTHGESMQMVERKGTKLYTWEYRVGEVVEGILIRRGLEKFTVEDESDRTKRVAKEAIGLTLLTPEGKLKMLAPFDLADKVEQGDVGHKVIVRYTGEENIGAGRKMKRFQVLVSRDKVRDVADAGLGITDEDIPF